MNFGKNMTSLEKDTAYNKLSQEAKTYIAIINDNGDKFYSTYNFANKKYLVYSIFGKFLKLNSKNSSFWASNNITNLFVLETDFQYEIDDIEEIKKELEKMVLKEKFSRFFNKIYIYGTCKIFEFELNKLAINEIRINEEIVSKAIINAKANTNYDIELK